MWKKEEEGQHRSEKDKNIERKRKTKKGIDQYKHRKREEDNKYKKKE